MADQIDSYLDGAVDRTALTPEERAHAERVDRVVEETTAFLGARPAPDLTAAVMRRVEQIGEPAAQHTRHVFLRLLDELWTPRDVAVRFRPVYALLVAAAVAALIVFSPMGLRPPAADLQFFVQFRLEAANASDVRLAGSFTNWQPQHELHETAPGIWTITLPLSPGVHDYVFIVDGEHWVSDPLAEHVSDGFGGTNSRIALLTPDQPRS